MFIKESNGLYTLTAVISHEGTSMYNGHYVAWVRHNELWMKFDDTKVSLATTNDILGLSGGDCGPTAYILLYGPNTLENNE